MSMFSENRFNDFFVENNYIFLKNYLYNYLLRKRAVENSLKFDNGILILESGSGISPVVTGTASVIYSDLSFDAVSILKRNSRHGDYVVADAMKLPFKTGIFSHTVCSEVLEHLSDDRAALKELSRVMRPCGFLVATVPHKEAYFGNDDRFVHHYRRYEINDFVEKLRAAGLKCLRVQKVLGPLEKLTMSLVVFCFSRIEKLKAKGPNAPPRFRLMEFLVPVFKWSNRLYMGLVWLDARVMPRALASVVLVKAKKI